MYGQEGCLPRGGIYLGVYGQEGCLLRGDVHLPPVNRIRDRCKNITFPQLRLRPVKSSNLFADSLQYKRIVTFNILSNNCVVLHCCKNRCKEMRKAPLTPANLLCVNYSLNNGLYCTKGPFTLVIY